SDVVREYAPDRLGRVLSNALQDPNGRADLLALLNAERGVIRHAHQAGRDIAGFLSADKTADALAALTNFGTQVTTAFNDKIGGLFSGKELRPLGTLVFLEAARAFDATLGDVRPSAMMQLTVLKENPAFDMESFVDGTDASAADIVRTEKFVSL